MIDRYAIYSDFSTILDRFDLQGDEFTVPNYNAAPAQALPIISNTNLQEISFFFWGASREMSNNRPISEKLLSANKNQLLSKALFKSSLEKRRCLIPINGFYLWKRYGKKSKIPHYFFIPDSEIICLPGIWEENEDIEGNLHYTFRIIETVNYINTPEFGQSMPVIMPKEMESIWLDSYSTIDELMGILDNQDMNKKVSYHPVSPHISNRSVNHAELIKPQQQVDQLGNYTLFE